MAVSSLRERLAKLQSKTRNNKNGVKHTYTANNSKKSFFNNDNQQIDETSLTNTDEGSIKINNLTFSEVDFTKAPDKSAILKVINKLSKRYIFPQVRYNNSGDDNGDNITNTTITNNNNHTSQLSLLSANSKTSKISKQYPNIIIQDQLYAIFRNQETLIDKLVNELVMELKLKTFNMNFENFNFNIIIMYKDYLKILNDSFNNKDENLKNNFLNLFNLNPLISQISNNDLNLINLNPSLLISKGLICISNSNNVINNNSNSNYIYNLTLPHLGGLLRIIKNSVNWIINNTSKTRENLIMATDLRNLWFKTYIPPKTQINNKNNNNTSFKREYFISDRVGVVKPKLKQNGPGVNIVKFRGIGLEWILALMIGVGILESYQSSVGIIYKSTGKRL